MSLIKSLIVQITEYALDSYGLLLCMHMTNTVLWLHLLEMLRCNKELSIMHIHILYSLAYYIHILYSQYVYAENSS